MFDRLRKTLFGHGNKESSYRDPWALLGEQSSLYSSEYIKTAYEFISNKGSELSEEEIRKLYVLSRSFVNSRKHRIVHIGPYGPVLDIYAHVDTDPVFDRQAYIPPTEILVHVPSYQFGSVSQEHMLFSNTAFKISGGLLVLQTREGQNRWDYSLYPFKLDEVITSLPNEELYTQIYTEAVLKILS